jgi:hypothetical protein
MFHGQQATYPTLYTSKGFRGSESSAVNLRSSLNRSGLPHPRACRADSRRHIMMMQQMPSMMTQQMQTQPVHAF